MWTGLRNAFLLAVLVSAAGLTWWWSRPAPTPATAANGGARPASYMTEAVMLLTNADGTMDIEIRAARVSEHPEENRLDFEQVSIERLREGALWRISAARASGPADGSVLALEGNVELRLERPGDDPYIVRMPQLHFDRASAIARSDGPVEVLSGSQRLTAERLEADLNVPRLRLESVQSMNISQVIGGLALAALSTAAAAQDDTQSTSTGRWSSVECETDHCVFRDFVLTRERWRLEAKEARAAELDAVVDGELRLTDVRFEIDGTTLATPTAVFNFVDKQLGKAELSGSRVDLVIDDATFTATHILFELENGEVATVKLAGKPATLVDRSDKREKPARVTADTLTYDYREHSLHMLGTVVFARDGNEVSFCDLSYDFDTERLTSNQVECGDRFNFRVVPTGREPRPTGNP